MSELRQIPRGVEVQCRQARKVLGQRTVLDGIDWTVPPGAIAGLVGASGAGKTTLLRIIAGLETCTSGSVRIARPESESDGRSVAVGMVFQDLALWPHLSARQHLECVLSHLNRAARRRRSEELLAESLLPVAAWNRAPAKLSGGEAQRLALARALAVNPQLLLLDEPLAQLDRDLKTELLAMLGRLAASRSMTTIYVTHQIWEAESICHSIAVIERGRLSEQGRGQLATTEGGC